MSTQIALRLPDDLVAYLDDLVAEGMGSRAVVVTRALRLYQQRLRAEQDARILEESGDYGDFEDLAGHQAFGA
jgi:metal-responsive CopG/Arc/MetJ family transcriptional regulator